MEGRTILSVSVAVAPRDSPFLQADTQVVASYDHRGKQIYIGNSRGRILVVTADSVAKVVAQFKASHKFRTDAILVVKSNC